jgi:anti-anti-sigma factor
MAKTVLRRLDGIVVVELKGKIDTATAAATERMLFEQSAGARQLVVDLSAVGYINSAGLRALLAAGQRMHAIGGRLTLCAVPSYVKEVLDIAGFSMLFPIRASRAEALAEADAEAAH